MILHPLLSIHLQDCILLCLSYDMLKAASQYAHLRRPDDISKPKQDVPKKVISCIISSERAENTVAGLG